MFGVRFSRFEIWQSHINMENCFLMHTSVNFSCSWNHKGAPKMSVFDVSSKYSTENRFHLISHGKFISIYNSLLTLSLSLFLVCQWKNFFLTHFHPKEKPAQINVSFRFNRHFVKSYIKMHVEMLQLIYQSISMRYLFIGFSEVTNNGRPMNPSLSEDSVADTAISKRNSDGMIF